MASHTIRHDSEDRVKSRMFQSVARLWNLREAEISALDPIVGLLIGACASEVEKISHDINSSQARVLERLAELLTPDVISQPHPAQAILHASPVEPRFVVSADTQMYLRKSNPSGNEEIGNAEKQIFFSPTGDYEVFRADVRYAASNTFIYQVTNSIDRHVVAEAEM